MIGSAHAHGGSPRAAAFDAGVDPTLDPLLLLPLLALCLLYAAGLHRAWRRAGIGRGVSRREAGAFVGGIAALALALVGPLDALGERLFSAHMAQHLLLMNLAAPLLVLSAPLQVLLRPLPHAARRRVAAVLQSRAWRRLGRVLGSAALVTLLQQALMWGWHTPAGIARALSDEPVHIAMHASLLAAALLFWRVVLAPGSRRPGPRIAALAATIKINGLVCIVMLLQPDALYSAYGDAAAAFGLTPAEDEQLGWGLMMLLGAATPLAALALRLRDAIDGCAAPRRLKA